MPFIHTLTCSFPTTVCQWPKEPVPPNPPYHPFHFPPENPQSLTTRQRSATPRVFMYVCERHHVTHLAAARMRSSTELTDMSRMTRTSFFCPIRWARSWACRSWWGFQSESKITTVSAVWAVRGEKNGGHDGEVQWWSNPRYETAKSYLVTYFRVLSGVMQWGGGEGKLWNWKHTRQIMPVPCYHSIKSYLPKPSQTPYSDRLDIGQVEHQSQYSVLLLSTGRVSPSLHALLSIRPPLHLSLHLSTSPPATHLQIESQSAGSRGQHEEEVLGLGLVEGPQQLAAVLGLGSAVQTQIPGHRAGGTDRGGGRVSGVFTVRRHGGSWSYHGEMLARQRRLSQDRPGCWLYIQWLRGTVVRHCTFVSGANIGTDARHSSAHHRYNGHKLATSIGSYRTHSYSQTTHTHTLWTDKRSLAMTQFVERHWLVSLVVEVVLHDGHQLGHLAEEQHPVAAVLQLGQDPVQQLELAGRSEQVRPARGGGGGGTGVSELRHVWNRPYINHQYQPSHPSLGWDFTCHWVLPLWW